MAVLPCFLGHCIIPCQFWVRALYLGCAMMRSRDTMNSAQQGPCIASGMGPSHFANVSFHTCIHQ